MQIPLTVQPEYHKVNQLSTLAQRQNTNQHKFAKLAFRAELSQLATNGECGDRATEPQEKPPTWQ